MMQRETFDAAQKALSALRLDGDGDLIVNVGTHGRTSDCSRGYMSATVRRGADVFTGEAVNLFDAVLIARARLTDMAKARAEALAKAKAEASS